jgi:glycosyltransferase involved in cell wall biosynthesis
MSNETLSIVVSVFGDTAAWEPLARRAIASAERQSAPAEVIYSTGSTLQDARNSGAARAQGDWLVFLDADDTLDWLYVEKMLEGTGDVRQPATLGVHLDGREDPAPVMIPRRNHFSEGNWVVVGAGVRHDLFDEVGGFSYEDLYEDWSLWWRCWLAGGEIGTAPEAIYRVSVHAPGEGRNQPAPQQQQYWFKEISDRLRSQPRRQRAFQLR